MWKMRIVGDVEKASCTVLFEGYGKLLIEIFNIAITNPVSIFVDALLEDIEDNLHNPVPGMQQDID